MDELEISGCKLQNLKLDWQPRVGSLVSQFAALGAHLKNDA